MHNFQQVDKAIKVMCIKGFFMEKHFFGKKYLEIYSGVYNILVLVQSNFTKKMIPNLIIFRIFQRCFTIMEASKIQQFGKHQWNNVIYTLFNINFKV